VLHAKYVCKILHQARFILKSLPNFNRIDLSDLHHVFIIGDLHGQLADLLHIFNENGLPGTDNPYIFNGDFVDRGEQSVEIILLLMVSLILYPSSLFLNRGNHEDIMVTARYGFQKEVTQKYQSVQKPLFDLFKDVFSWLPMYSYVKTGKTRIIIIHGGISDRINLTTINSLRRNRYISMEIPPKSEHGEAHLTADEKNEYHQVEDLLWSDPDPKGLHGSRRNDSRNIGCFFGSDITDQFLKKNNFSMLIRSHQVKEKGYEFAHHRKVITVFSASNYEKGSNSGAILRWGYNEDEPRIIQHKLQRAQDMQALSFDKQVTLLEDPAYQALIEKIMAKKSSLQKEFDKADRNQTAHLPVIVWSKIMTNVLEADLPWFTLRSKLVEEDAQGVRYNTMFDGYALYNTKFQMSHTGIMEDLYMWKDTLLMLFNLIDSNHSGFINAEEFADIIKLLLSDEDGAGNVSQKYIDELCSAIDLDGNGRIDANEFLDKVIIQAECMYLTSPLEWDESNPNTFDGLYYNSTKSIPLTDLHMKRLFLLNLPPRNTSTVKHIINYWLLDGAGGSQFLMESFGISMLKQIILNYYHEKYHQTHPIMYLFQYRGAGLSKPSIHCHTATTWIDCAQELIQTTRPTSVNESLRIIHAMSNQNIAQDLQYQIQYSANQSQTICPTSTYIYGLSQGTGIIQYYLSVQSINAQLQQINGIILDGILSIKKGDMFENQIKSVSNRFYMYLSKCQNNIQCLKAFNLVTGTNQDIIGVTLTLQMLFLTNMTNPLCTTNLGLNSWMLFSLIASQGIELITTRPLAAILIARVYRCSTEDQRVLSHALPILIAMAQQSFFPQLIDPPYRYPADGMAISIVTVWSDFVG
ncbi:unnamed protein product, partial [Rotaria magnacalcarata]